jgi:hypothetical protein
MRVASKGLPSTTIGAAAGLVIIPINIFSHRDGKGSLLRFWFPFEDKFFRGTAEGKGVKFRRRGIFQLLTLWVLRK